MILYALTKSWAYHTLGMILGDFASPCGLIFHCQFSKEIHYAFE